MSLNPAGLFQWRMTMALIAIMFPVALIFMAFSGCDIRQRSAKHACRDGSAAQCLAVGEFYESRTGGMIAYLLSNATTAERYYNLGCKHGSSKSCARFGHMIVNASYDSMFDSGFSNADGMTALETACDGGEIDACRELAGAVKSAEAAPILEKLCSGGDNVSCDKLLYTYSDSDPKRADLLEKRCDAGKDDSCHELASRLLAGSNVAKADSARASAVLAKACDRGDASACTDLGDGYLTGAFGSDLDRARDAFVKGCNADYYRACFAYNKMLVDSEPAKAVAWFTADCKHEASSCDALGDLYRVGVDGIASDRERARSFYQRACKAKSKYSCDKLDCFDGDEDACNKAYELQPRVQYRLGGRFDIQ